MRQVKVLDCTLRDGGRIIDCKFPDADIKNIAYRLSQANIDIVEMGFLRDPKIVDYVGNSTFFTTISQVNRFIKSSEKDTSYVVFVDYSLYDFSTLEKYKVGGINGIRVGFTKNDFINHRDSLVEALKYVKKQGYELYIQGVNSLAYTDKEFLDVIDMVNNVIPNVFAIVDTYGAMYLDDLQHIYRLTNRNLNPDISIAFHSHNNFQLSFALAQEFIKLGKESNRNIIIDSTLNGMGKCAGNLNTELIVDFLVRKMYYNYDFEGILDIIDDYTYNIKKQYHWGYTIPSVMAAVYQSHPNNIIYLTDKFRLATKDIKRIISMIPDDLRKRYDYDYIKNLYIKYNHTNIDDTESIKEIRKKIKNKNILILVPGHSLIKFKDKILETIDTNNTLVIPINFISKDINYNKQLPFFGSEKRYLKFKDNTAGISSIVVSNIMNPSNSDYIVNYESLIERDNEDFDTSIIMCLNLLLKLDIKNITFAGFDGFDESKQSYFDTGLFEEGRFNKDYKRLTQNITNMLKQFAKKIDRNSEIKFLTPSMYEDIFKKERILL